MSTTVQDVEEIVAMLMRVSAFAGADLAALSDLASGATVRKAVAGEIICRAGAPSDEVFVVLSGRVEVSVEDRGELRLLGDLGPGQTVGEVGVINQAPRQGLVRAVRDSRLLVIGGSHFMAVVGRRPALATWLLHTFADRLVTVSRRVRSERRRVIALIAVDPRVHLEQVCSHLVDAFQRTDPEGRKVGHWGPTSFEGDFDHWLEALEANHETVVLRTNPDDTRWLHACLGAADVVCVVASGEGKPHAGSELLADLVATAASTRRCELLLLHQQGCRPQGTEAWQRALQLTRVRHLGLHDVASLDRVARSLRGNARTLALGGGGARGFGHLGVWKALVEARVPIDAVGGTSMGSLVAGLIAVGMSPEEGISRMRKEMLKSGSIFDVTVPSVGLLAGSNLGQRVRRMVGDIRIEDLQVPYVAVSANLSQVRSAHHESGPLWLAIRASGAIPGIVAPVIMEGEVHVDGGIVDNLPTEPVRRLAAGPLTAVNVVPRKDERWHEVKREPVVGNAMRWHRLRAMGGTASGPGLMDILTRSLQLSSIQRLGSVETQADLFIDLPLGHFDSLEPGPFDEIVEVGYRHATQLLAERGRALGIDR